MKCIDKRKFIIKSALRALTLKIIINCALSALTRELINNQDY